MNDVVPVEALTDARQRFHCAPLAAIIPARTCVARRARALPWRSLTCTHCDLGADVERVLQAAGT